MDLISDAALGSDQPDSPATLAGCNAEETLFETIACNIEQHGYVYLPSVLPEDLADSLIGYIARLEQDRFSLAATGRGRDRGRNRFVRRDRIHWLEDSHPSLAAWFGWIQRLKTYLNRRLYLGLFSFECHLAHYSKGDFYRKHVDAFKGEANRVLSMVTYLNRGWEAGHGGELVIYSPEDDAELLRVLPGFGTLVLFLSEEFSHEVLPTQRDRYTVAGWFRLNNSINDNIDPPR